MSFFNQHINHDACVCCGGYVPEGRQVCISCEKKSEEPGKEDSNIVGEKNKICVFCARWQPEGKIQEITRNGCKCPLTGNKTRTHDSCWGWIFCSPSQLDERKNAGLLEEVKGNE